MAKNRRTEEVNEDVVDVAEIQEVSMSDAMAEDAEAAAAGESGTATAEKVDRRKGPRGPRPPSMKWPDDPDGTNPKDLALGAAILQGGSYETIVASLAENELFAEDLEAGLLTIDAVKKRIQVWKDKAKEAGQILKLPRLVATFAGRSAAPNIGALNDLFAGGEGE